MSVENRVLLIGDPLQQVPVMGDHDQCSGPGVQHVLDLGEHFDIDVVGGLVEHQHVGFGQQSEHELQPPPLSTGEFAHP